MQLVSPQRSKSFLAVQILLLSMLFTSFASSTTRSALLPSGNTVIVYESKTDPQNILFSIIDPTGAVFLESKQVNVMDRRAESPDVAAIEGGGFVVVFEAVGNIFFQLYDEDGNEYKDQYQINDIEENSYHNPSVAKLIDDKFVVAYEGGFDIVYQTDIYFAVLNTEAYKFLGPFVANTYTVRSQSSPRVASSYHGLLFMIVWQSLQEVEGNLQWGVYGRLYEAHKFLPISEQEFRINSDSTAQQIRPDIAGFSEESYFMIAWRTDEPAIRAAVYLGPHEKDTIRISSQSLPDFDYSKTNDPFVKLDNNNEGLIGWREESTGSESVLYYSRFNREGVITTTQTEAHQGEFDNPTFVFLNDEDLEPYFVVAGNEAVEFWDSLGVEQFVLTAVESLYMTVALLYQVTFILAIWFGVYAVTNVLDLDAEFDFSIDLDGSNRNFNIDIDGDGILRVVLMAVLIPVGFCICVIVTIITIKCIRNKRRRQKQEQANQANRIQVNQQQQNIANPYPNQNIPMNNQIYYNWNYQQQQQQELAKPPSANEAQKNCVVCMNAVANIVLSDCMHICLCEQCWDALQATGNKECPVCRSPIKDGKKVFYS